MSAGSCELTGGFLSSALDRDNVHQNLILSDKNVHCSNESSFTVETRWVSIPCGKQGSGPGVGSPREEQGSAPGSRLRGAWSRARAWRGGGWGRGRGREEEEGEEEKGKEGKVEKICQTRTKFDIQ